MAAQEWRLACRLSSRSTQTSSFFTSYNLSLIHIKSRIGFTYSICIKERCRYSLLNRVKMPDCSSKKNSKVSIHQPNFIAHNIFVLWPIRQALSSLPLRYLVLVHPPLRSERQFQTRCWSGATLFSVRVLTAHCILC